MGRSFIRTSRLYVCLLLLAAAAVGNEISYRMLQSGSPNGPTPLHDRGIHGEGQIIAILDSGLDRDNCYFAEPGNLPPPVNPGSPTGGYQFANVDLSRRKVIAYDFLSSCNQRATLIASARRVPLRDTGNGGIVPTEPVPSYQQGFGFPGLDDALYFEGDRPRLRIVDVSYEISVRAPRIGRGPAQGFALVMVGDLVAPPARRRAVTR